MYNSVQILINLRWNMKKIIIISALIYSSIAFCDVNFSAGWGVVNQQDAAQSLNIRIDDGFFAAQAAGYRSLDSKKFINSYDASAFLKPLPFDNANLDVGLSYNRVSSKYQASPLIGLDYKATQNIELFAHVMPLPFYYSKDNKKELISAGFLASL